MNQLLDAHAFLWFVQGSDRLSAPARKQIEHPDAVNWISIATLWELSIKHSLGKLQLSAPFQEFIEQQFTHYQFDTLPVELADVYRSHGLPYHHRDPFDRIVIAQALVRGWQVLTVDPAFDAYGVRRIW